MKHVKALLTILIGQRDAGALQRFSLAVTRPGPAEIAAPGTDSRSVLDRRRFLQAMAPRDVHGVAVPIPDELDGGEWMVPTEIHSADTGPVTRKLSMLADNLGFLDREYSAGAENRN